MKTHFLFFIVAILLFNACKKSDSAADTKSKFVGTWAGEWQVTNPQSGNYNFSLVINSDNTVLETDSAFGTPPPTFNGTYTYTSDSIKITYPFPNGTQTHWNFAFQNNYTAAAGTGVAADNVTPLSMSMTKK